jgi:eukaryotic-like serine/threonine-protein kinase
MSVQAGTMFGPYRIGAPIGAGGMGEVYEAVDTRLERRVAIKVLSGHLSGDPLLRERFEREARAVSAISHPHICALYDVGREGGVFYLVMEYLEGETLADRLESGPLPIQQVLRYGTEIAEALETAHRLGVVHRDLKPGNIMITRSGAKLLDFGLAKFAEAASASTPGASEMETQQKPLTREGTLLGTFQYMAPEQLDGETADARSDIFALGAVLYEMTTGKRAFEGKSRSSLIAAIVSADPPPLSSVQPLSPSGLERVVRTCLAKDPEDRWNTAHDVALELKWIARELSQGGTEVARGAVKRRRPSLLWLLAAALLIPAAIGIAMWSRPAVPAREIRLHFDLPQAYIGSVQVSPDGTKIAVTARGSKIMIRSLDGKMDRDVDVPVENASLFWSPDSRSLAFHSGRKLLRLDVAGGPFQEITEEDYGVGGVWLEDGTIIFAPRWGDGLYRVPAAGGKGERLTTLDVARRESVHAWPRAIPGTDHILFLRRTIAAERSEIHAMPARGGDTTKVIEADALIEVTPRHLYYLRDAALYRQPFDTRAKQVKGQPERVVDLVHYREVWAHGLASIDTAETTLAYVQWKSQPITLRWFDREGNPLEDLAIHDNVDQVHLSPDGRRLATCRVEPRQGAEDVWIYDLARGVDTRLTSSPGSDESPRWTADGRSILFQSDLEGLYGIWLVPADGSAEPRPFFSQPGSDVLMGTLSPDGKILITQVSNPQTSFDLWTVPFDDPAKATPWLATPAYETGPNFSPDGQWLAYASSALFGGGSTEVYVRSFPGPGQLVQISNGGGFHARWSKDGSEILFVADRTLMAVQVARRGGELDPGIPRKLFDLPKEALSTFEISPDGNRLLIPIATGGRDGIRLDVISTWPTQ